VRNGFREFVLEDPGIGLDALVATALSAGGDTSWANGGPVRTCRRTWLDTFDWRLYRAGLALEQRTSREAVDLTLTGRDAEVLAAERIDPDTAPPWPAKLDGLPAGPLYELLEPVVGVRALLPVARATSRLSERRALNADAKTIARLGVDRMSVSFPAKAAAPVRLTLTAVRGYQRQTDRLGAALAGVPGISPDSASGLDAALAAAGQRPGSAARARGARLRAEAPAAKAMASILTALLDSIEVNVPGTTRDIDSEFLHDLRVAVRWTRSALKLAGDVLPGGLAARFAPEFRWLGDLTTPARDLDVYQLGFPGMAAGLIAAAPEDLLPFRDYLDRSRAVAHRDLTRGLRSSRFRRLCDEWRAELTALRRARKGPTVADLADERIAAANRKVLTAGHRITGGSPPASLHALRKRCKELRYLIEMFGSLHDPGVRWQAVRELKALQDCLGEFQDAQVQREEIGVFAAQMLAEHSAPAPTLLAMGEIAACLARRQLQARSEFDGRFASFAGPASQARLAALTRTATA
jgi:CHAD domain-containing protein